MSTPLPELQHFSVRVDGNVAVLSYNLPRTGNSLKYAVLKSMLEAMRWATAEPTIRVIVQTGTGKFFTTGRDMEVGEPEGSGADLPSRIEMFRQLNDSLITCPKVLIAAVNGPAAGYGVTSLALYDLVYSIPDAYFFTPFSKWALCPEGCSSVTFPAIMGHQKAAALLLAGDRMTARELCDAGLLTKILDAEGFLEEVLKIAHRIAAYPPKALAQSKGLLVASRRDELLEANKRECECLAKIVLEDECIEAVSQFAKEQERKKAAGGSKSRL
ncbi:ClpP/crotonase-like domain-containing protein [Plectosphaerella plurivora]|uniref:ClpP/crotonase-like domain-containing protein n=1 Tax=Plectosphaerella plurivora TaxID=936078 RepID=A0A9P8V5X7_9PEZI|nr:ClpP/crotonase-like domain-containing protein [Plectosphaerella plurivora]